MLWVESLWGLAWWWMEECLVVGTHKMEGCFLALGLEPVIHIGGKENGELRL